MLVKTSVIYLKFLYRNVFNEDPDNSEEFRIFVENNNPHPLRIKVEDFIYNQKDVVTDLATEELDAFITNYIETLN